MVPSFLVFCNSFNAPPNSNFFLYSSSLKVLLIIVFKSSPFSLNTKESIFLKGKINKEVYHLEIDNGNNTKSTIEIHLKNPLEKDLALERNNKNNV